MLFDVKVSGNLEGESGSIWQDIVVITKYKMHYNTPKKETHLTR